MEIPVDLDGSNYITYLTDACNEHNYEGHLLPSGCYATEDFYDRENLSTKEGRRPITAGVDVHRTVRAWQVVVTALLSDYKYLYE